MEQHAGSDEAPESSESSPLAALEVLAVQEVAITDSLVHLELFTLRGLLTIFWHGPRDASAVVLACGGAMGGLLGPADGLYHDLGVGFASRDIATLRVGWRKPNDLERCTHDLVAAADLAFRSGGRRFVTIGHSFGGAIALRAGIMLGDQCRGVVTLSTQSAGCEVADQLPPTPLLLFHGDRDELLPVAASQTVQHIAGGESELVVLPGTGHLLTEAGAVVRERLSTWIPDRLAEEAP